MSKERKEKKKKQEKETVDTHTDPTPLHEKEKRKRRHFFTNRTDINMKFFSEHFFFFSCKLLVGHFILVCCIFTVYIFLKKIKKIPTTDGFGKGIII